MATIDGILFAPAEVVLETSAESTSDDGRISLDHAEAVRLAAALIVHVVLGQVDAGAPVEPGDELNRVLRSASAQAVEMLCASLVWLRELRTAEAMEVVGATERALAVHDGGGEVTGPRSVALAVVRDA